MSLSAVAGLSGVLVEGARAVLARVFPDPVERAKAEAELLKLQHEGNFDQRAALALANLQGQITLADAKGDAFQRRWRPAAGWVCVLGLAVQFLAAPLLQWGLILAGKPLPVAAPTIEPVLMELLAVLLGVGGFRTFEKVKGKA